MENENIEIKETLFEGVGQIIKGQVWNKSGREIPIAKISTTETQSIIDNLIQELKSLMRKDLESEKDLRKIIDCYKDKLIYDSNKDKEEIERKYTRLNLENKSLNLEIENKTLNLENVTKNLENVTKNLENLESEVKIWKGRYSQLEEQHRGLVGISDNERGRIIDYILRIKDLIQENNKLKKQLKSIEINKISPSNYSVEVEKLKFDLENSKNEIYYLKSKINESNNKAQESDSKIIELENEINNLIRKLWTYKKTNSRMEGLRREIYSYKLYNNKMNIQIREIFNLEFNEINKKIIIIIALITLNLTLIFFLLFFYLIVLIRKKIKNKSKLN